jgi:putative ABC transport system permease protein
MNKYLGIIVQNVFRNPTRAVLCLLGILIAIAVFAFVGAVSNGLDTMTDASAGEGNLVVFQKGRYCPGKSQLPVSYLDRVKGIEGIEEVMPLKVHLNKCTANFEMVTINGIDPQKLPIFKTIRVDKEAYLSFMEDPQGAIVGKLLAEKMGWKKGETVRIKQLRGFTITIYDIFNEPGSSFNAIAFAHLDHVAGFLEDTETITEIFVMVKDTYMPSEISQQIDRVLSAGPVKTKTRPENVFLSESVSDVKTIIGFSKAVAFVAVFILLLGVGNTIYITTIDRRKEIAIYRALGFEKSSIFGMIFGEAAVTSVIGGILGTAATAVFIRLVPMGIGIEGHTVSIIFTPKLAILSIIVAFVVGVFSSIIPALMASKQPVASELRNVG